MQQRSQIQIDESQIIYAIKKESFNRHSHYVLLIFDPVEDI